jgi:hypothetical protein
MSRLFKYVTADTGKKILENQTLRWSVSSLLNDPFDMQFAFQLRFDRQKARTLALEKYWQHMYGELSDRPLNHFGNLIRQVRSQFPRWDREEFARENAHAIDQSIDAVEQNMLKFNAEIVQGQFSKDKILCLSDAPDSILMWSYYAENHSGLVLRFTDQTLNNPFKMARKVRYVEQMPSLFDDDLLSDMLAGYDVMTPRRIMDEVIWTKSGHWAHEREWRIFAGSGRGNGDYEDVPFTPKELDGIIFGARTATTDKTAIKVLAQQNYPHTEILQAQTNSNAYELKIEKF